MFTHSFPEPHGIHRTYVFCNLLRLWLERLRETPDSLPSPVSQFSKGQVHAILFPFSAQAQQTVFLRKHDDSEVFIVLMWGILKLNRADFRLKNGFELGNRLLDDQTPTQKIGVCRRAR
jgi:hypothetical protein